MIHIIYTTEDISILYRSLINNIYIQDLRDKVLQFIDHIIAANLLS